MVRSRWAIVVFLSAVLATVTVAAPMRIAINFKVSLQKNTLLVQATSTDGYPINGANFEAVLTNTSSSTVKLTEVGQNGMFTGPVPTLVPGPVTLRLRDVSYPDQVLEVEQQLSWPLTEPVTLVLPALPRERREGTPWLWLVGAVVLLSAAAWTLLRGRRPERLTT